MAIVAAISAGYVQMYDTNGNTIWTDQPNATTAWYGSWRGAYFFQYPTSRIEVYNNTTSAVSWSLFGYVYRGPVQADWPLVPLNPV